MEDQIITQQIDVVVIGDRKLELVALMLEQELLLEEPQRNHSHAKYIELLAKLVGDPIIPESSSSNGLGLSTPAKFTKVILTNSFWLHIHFFVHDNKVFDPFVSQACRGSVNLCIIAASEGIDLTATKAYLLQQNVAKPLKGVRESGMVRPQAILEAQVMATAHEIAVGGFPSVLALKIAGQAGQKRIMEESSNLRLTINQISRWIVDRHFQVKHRTKIDAKLGDEIEYYQQKRQKSYCALI